MIKVSDIAYVRLRAPDLDRMEAFLVDFGMVRSARTESALYMRGSDPSHHIHVTERGDPAFIGVAFHAAAAKDLDTIARAETASAPEAIDEPGGGRRVRLTDPHGFQVEVVHGIEALDALPARQAHPENRGRDRARFGQTVRTPKGPAQVKRLGHVLVTTPDLATTNAFYLDHFGLIPSDRVYEGEETRIVASFNRCDRGEEFVDHHTFVPVFHPGEPGFQHAAFEVENVQALMIGHEFLASRGHRHSWGVGRHFLGSQIFDYWYDPFGRIHEHWTDGDLFDATREPGLSSLEEALGTQWGPPVPEEFL